MLRSLKFTHRETSLSISSRIFYLILRHVICHTRGILWKSEKEAFSADHTVLVRWPFETEAPLPKFRTWLTRRVPTDSETLRVVRNPEMVMFTPGELFHELLKRKDGMPWSPSSANGSFFRSSRIWSLPCTSSVLFRLKSLVREVIVLGDIITL